MSIHIHPAFALYLLLVIASSSWQVGLCAMGALVVHEACHCVVGCLLREQMMRIDLTPFGGILAYRPGCSPSKGIRGLCMAAAGPLGNYLAVCLCTWPPVQSLMGRTCTQTFMLANLGMMCFNLLPVLPLDGGNMVLCVGYYVLPVARLIAWLTAAGVLTGIALMALAGYGLAAMGKLNVSLTMVGGYMVIHAVRSRKTMLAQNLYAVVQERSAVPERVRMLRLYRVPPDVRLQALLDPMERAECAAFLFEDERGIQTVSEGELCRMLLDNPCQTLKQAFDRKKGG